MFEKVQEIIAREMDIDKNIITMDSRLTEDLGADSLDAAEIIMSIEDEFGIKVPTDAAANITTVGDAFEEIKKVLQ